MKAHRNSCKSFFFMLMFVGFLLSHNAAFAGGPCSEGQMHQGPYSYRNRVNPTCTENGRQDKYCDACDSYVGTEIISAFGHHYQTSTRVITHPTCLTAGLQQKKQICIICGYEASTSDESIPALGHAWGESTASWENGDLVITRVCVRDQTHREKLTLRSVLQLPAGVKTIEEEAFANGAFEAVLIPDSCTFIGSRAFADCPNLKYVYIPASVAFIADDAFEGSGEENALWMVRDH